MASSGRRASSTRGYLTPFARSVSTAKEVTSEPVPAVVGTATKRMSAPVPSFLPNSSMALAQSMGEPPPKATTAWGRNSASALAPWATSSRGGSGTTWSNTSTVQSRRRARTRSSRPDWARKESVITITRRPASPSRAAKASGPKKIVGLS